MYICRFLADVLQYQNPSEPDIPINSDLEGNAGIKIWGARGYTKCQHEENLILNLGLLHSSGNMGGLGTWQRHNSIYCSLRKDGRWRKYTHKKSYRHSSIPPVPLSRTFGYWGQTAGYKLLWSMKCCLVEVDFASCRDNKAHIKENDQSFSQAPAL